MTQVFVSYSRHDEERARPVLDALARSGFRVSHAQDPPGMSFADAIAQKIERADCVVVVWSRAAARSEWVQREVHLAIEAWSAGKLVLVSLDDAPLPVGLRDLEAIPIRGEDAMETHEVVRRVEEMARGGQQPRAIAAQSRTPPAPLASARGRRGSAGALVGGLLGLLLVAGLGAYWFSVGSAPPPSEQVGGGAEQPGKGAPSSELPSPAPQPPPPPNEGAGQPPDGGDVVSPFPESPAPDPGSIASQELNRDFAAPNPLLVGLATGLVGIAIGAGLAFALWRWSRRRRVRPEASIAPANATASLQSAVASLPDGMPVFVSYSREDLRDVDRLVKQIEQAGYGVWIDRQAHGSQRYAAPIVRAIKSSQLVALMCSSNAFKSDHVIREIYIAGDCKKPFLVFQLDHSEFPDEVLYFVTGFPRLSVTALDPQGLRTELSRLLVN